MNRFKDVLRFATANSPNHKVEHIFITQKLFNERLSFARYKSPFGDKIFGSKFWQIFRGFILAYDETVTILSRLIFAFATSVLFISNVLMVRKEVLIIKSPKLQ